MSLQYIIDGYNIINHSQFTRRNSYSENPKSSLLAFIRIKRLTGSKKNKVLVVFDGYPRSFENDSPDEPVRVIFSRSISADDKIKMMVEESAGRKNIMVVTDDKEIRLVVKSLGARCIGIEEFISSKEKIMLPQNKELLKEELNYSQIDKINQELRKIWLK